MRIEASMTLEIDLVVEKLPVGPLSMNAKDTLGP